MPAIISNVCNAFADMPNLSCGSAAVLPVVTVSFTGERGLSTIRLKARFLTDAEAIEKARSR